MNDKQFILYFLFLSSMLLQSCQKEDDNYLYEVTGINLLSADNSGESPEISNADSLEAKSFSIAVECSIKLSGSDGDDLDLYESSFLNRYKLTSFNIRTLEQFDDSHPAGASLNDYFLYCSFSSYSANSTIANLVSYNALGGSPPDREELHEEWKAVNYLIMMEQPANPGNYHFVVDLEYSNGLILSDTLSTKLY